MLRSWLAGWARTEPGEEPAVFWAFVYFFCLLASYYVLQPLRDEIGVQAGLENLPWLFIASLGVMLAANPVFAHLVACLPRRRLVPLVYRFFSVNLLLFLLAFNLLPATWQKGVGTVFFLWVSVFNLFAVSVFWSFMADVFCSAQGRRLFGFIGAGGTLGEVCGSWLTTRLAACLGSLRLPVVSLVLLEVALLAVTRLDAAAPAPASPTPEPGAASNPAPGSLPAPAPAPAPAPRAAAWDGVRLVVGSPYLLAICLYMFLYTFTSSFLYFEKAAIVKAAIVDPDARTAFFAGLNLWVSGLTLVIQLFLTGRLIGWLGLPLALAVVPGLTVAGFLALGAAPVLMVFAVVEVGRKAGNYALARPAREVLYTVVGRGEKYAAKNLIDTFVYRGGDAIAAGAFKLLTAFELGLSGLAWAGVPFAVLWAAVAVWLGRRQQTLAANRPAAIPVAVASSGH